MTDGVRGALEQLQAATDALASSPFVPAAGDLSLVEESLKEVRASVCKARADAADATRVAAAERARLAATLAPVRIDRTAQTAPVYAANRRVLANEKRYLYRCPLAGPDGVCKPAGARRPFRPAARRNVQSHIESWHLGKDKLRVWRRRSDDWWAEGAAEVKRARA
jgi:hypothetical protein